MMKSLFESFMVPDKEKDHPRFVRGYLILLAILMLAGWGYFLNFGQIPLDFHDWAEINAPRLAFLKDAVTKGQFPLHMPDSTALRGVTDRFMALPDVILSPQILLLRWMSVGTFVLADTWLMMIIGYFGLLRLKRRFSLSLLSFTWITLLFFLNGHLLAHYAVGHVTWGGVFLLSWFAELVFRLIDEGGSVAWETGMAFLLFFIFLQGSFHQFVWCVLFLGFLAISNWKLLLPILRSGVAAGLLSMVRVIPPAMQMGAFDDDFLGGYSGIKQFINAFIKTISPANSLNQAKTGSVQGWWEFDIHTGVTGLLLLGLGLLAWLLLRERKQGFPSLICPVAVLSLFSGDVRGIYSLLRSMRIPLFTAERITSRFLILPFIFLLTAGMTALQHEILKREKARLLSGIQAFLLLPLGFELGRELMAWRVTEAAKAFPYTHTDLSLKTVANHPDTPYTTGVLIGAAVTLLTAALLIFRLRHAEKNLIRN